MEQYLSKRRQIEPLFKTRSGIEVKRIAEVADRYNLLIKYNRSGQILLNGQMIDNTIYNKLLVTLELEHPDACVYANAYQIVFVYPKTEEEQAC